MKNPLLKLLLLSILTSVCAIPALAWDDSGHRIIAYIAWQQMSLAARERAVQLLLNAPEDSQLNALYPAPPDHDYTTYPPGARSKAAKQRDYFMVAAYWADHVRERKYEKRSKYHHGTWHYLDTFWRETNGRIEVITDMENDVGYKPATPVEIGVRRFVDWYLEYYRRN